MCSSEALDTFSGETTCTCAGRYLLTSVVENLVSTEASRCRLSGLWSWVVTGCPVQCCLRSEPSEVVKGSDKYLCKLGKLSGLREANLVSNWLTISSLLLI